MEIFPTAKDRREHVLHNVLGLMAAPHIAYRQVRQVLEVTAIQFVELRPKLVVPGGAVAIASIRLVCYDKYLIRDNVDYIAGETAGKSKYWSRDQARVGATREMSTTEPTTGTGRQRRSPSRQSAAPAARA